MGQRHEETTDRGDKYVRRPANAQLSRQRGDIFDEIPHEEQRVRGRRSRTGCPVTCKSALCQPTRPALPLCRLSRPGVDGRHRRLPGQSLGPPRQVAGLRRMADHGANRAAGRLRWRVLPPLVANQQCPRRSGPTYRADITVTGHGPGCRAGERDRAQPHRPHGAGREQQPPPAGNTNAMHDLQGVRELPGL
jgi:hypothetical protein